MFVFSVIYNMYLFDMVYILMLLYMFIAPGQGQTTPWGQNFDDKRKAFSLCPYVASFKMISSKSDLMILYVCIAPQLWQKTPWGQTFDVNRKPLSL